MCLAFPHVAAIKASNTFMPGDAQDWWERVGLQRNFTTTHWSEVRRAQEGDQAARDQFCRRCMFPVYLYLRSLKASPEDAMDVTQETLLKALSSLPDGGKLRSWLKTVAHNKWIDAIGRANAGKRGGGQRALELDAEELEQRFRLEAVDNNSPDQLYELKWALAILESALRRLREECESANKPQLFEVLKDHLPGNRTESYAEAADRLGSTEGAIKVAVHRLRIRLRDILREELCETVDNPAELKEEEAWLLQTLAG